MCGIVGIVNFSNKPVVERRLRLATDELRHRGPDDSGLYSAGSVGLGHRRLKVIDLSAAAAQPMTTPDGRYTITYNGEIYNFQELKTKYLSDVTLVSTSDTEVLLHLLAQRGAAMLRELRGMFALALWDNQEQELLLARDPFGKKPLYYQATDDYFAFASEPKALLSLKLGEPKIDRDALAQYFLYEYVPAPASGWHNIKQLPMGSWLKVRNGETLLEQWWQPQVQPKHTVDSPKRMLDQHLAMAVERRLVADVPVGVFLSGGIDSSTIAWYLKQQQSNVHSFSTSFTEEDFNEGSLAARVAHDLELEHHDVTFTAQDVVPTLRELVPKMDIPLADASLLPTYAVSKLARQHVTVVLDGDGSDELFGGYGTFKAAAAAEALPRWARRLGQDMAGFLQLLPTKYGYFTVDFKVKSFVRGLAAPLPIRNQIWLGSFTRRELRQLLTSAWQDEAEQVYEPIRAISQDLAKLPVADQVSLLTLEHYMHNGILTKLDRATMLVSLEARTPFLDLDLAEWALRLPTEYKRDKMLLKQLMRGRVPDVVIDRPKQGFALPLGQWLRGPLKQFVFDVLAEEKLRDDGVLVPSEVHRLLDEHTRGKADHRKKIWTLLMWQLWYDYWIMKRGLPS